MAAALATYRPDYAVPPGAVLEERLEALGLSHAAFAKRCGRSAKLISEIIGGKAPLEPETALQFERVLGVDAGIWLGIEADYRLHRARALETARAAARADWARAFPVGELVRRGCFERPASPAETVSKLLAFFGVGSIDAWTARYGALNVAYRYSPTLRSTDTALATWLRLGEVDALARPCADYDEATFRQATHAVRGLTTEPVDEALAAVRALCRDAGVALVLVPPLPKTALSGAAWWLSPRKAVIQLSGRHRTDDHLWFTFFHEAAHLLLHSKKGVFVDEADRGSGDIEVEADAWAANALVPRSRWRRFVATAPRSEAAVRRFAEHEGIAPGIVVGMLQHGGHLPWSHLNGLKVRLDR